MESKQAYSRLNIKTTNIILVVVFLTNCGFSRDNKSGFNFTVKSQGIELLEGKSPVYFYQKAPVSQSADFSCNNFLHPFYSLDGDTLTEISPKDQLHHRGIFWAWHQIFVDTARVGDGWMMKNISFDIKSAKTSTSEESAKLDLFVYWKSSVYQNGKPFIEEHTTITVHQSQPMYRLIDFEIQLKPLVPDVSIGGSEDVKGYGGFSPRVKLPKDLAFTSENGSVTPQNEQIKAGPWMDFSGTFNPNKPPCGLTILCHPGTPNYVAPWILRQEKSMQNIVFPGRERVKLTFDKPITLKYRLVVHRGKANVIDIAKLQSAYSK